MSTLTFFTVTGTFDAVTEPNPASNLNTPRIRPVNALITFTPRLPEGQPLLVTNYEVAPSVFADTAISLPPLTARIWNGVLSTIDYADTPGFDLVANTPDINLTQDLIYEISFTKVTFNGAPQALASFAFTAPTTNTPISITAMALPRGFTATIHYPDRAAITHNLDQPMWNRRPTPTPRPRSPQQQRTTANLPTRAARRGGRL